MISLKIIVLKLPRKSKFQKNIFGKIIINKNKSQNNKFKKIVIKTSITY